MGRGSKVLEIHRKGLQKAPDKKEIYIMSTAMKKHLVSLGLQPIPFNCKRRVVHNDPLRLLTFGMVVKGGESFPFWEGDPRSEWESAYI